MPRQIIANELHEAARRAMVKALKPYADQLGAVEMLAITAQLVGQLIAFQDQRVPPGAIMDMVAANIEAGNARAIEGLFEGAEKNGRN